jgi:4'-phosphopantetheinyl transferase EntD
MNLLLPTVDRLSHQDKLRLIHFLLLAVAKEEGCDLEPSIENESKNTLLTQMASTEGLVWSPQSDAVAVQALSDLLIAAKESANA